MITINSKIQVNKQGLIVSWAVAECGLGGIMHALKIPFTGIVVGSIAVTCISLIAYYAEDVKSEVLKALITVLIIKLAVSPHSPWQAYVAVIFQGLLGSVMLRSDRWMKWRIFVFAVVCLAESALQKLLLSVLIFGLEFFTAMDLVLNALASFFGFTMQGSYSFLLMIIYLTLHILVGITLGLFIPKIPSQLTQYSDIFIQPSSKLSTASFKIDSTSRYKQLIFLSFAVIVIIAFHFYLPAQFIWLNILLRALIVTALMTLIVGPAIMYLIKNRLTGLKTQNSLSISAQEIILSIPEYKSLLFARWSYIRSHYRGIERIKLFLLSAISVSQVSHSTTTNDVENSTKL
jgi:hypothetical protein